ncbi:hypothetical protein SAMN02910264_02112 [Ruminococcaceae bacterium YAD3003]|nr:hypothetical protein SAMN02910264_02112 [Ruminococcaceae bacterium YAD3003]
MTNKDRENILSKYNMLSSWMLWDDNLPKDKINWEKVKTNCVFVALNPSDEAPGKWLSFHKSGSKGDANLRAAFEGSKYEGCYVTDLIKYKDLECHEVFKTAKSNLVKIEMAKNPQIYKRNVDALKEELGCFDEDLTIFVFGENAYNMIAYNPDISCAYKVVRISHFSPPSKYAMTSKEYISQIKKELKI